MARLIDADAPASWRTRCPRLSCDVMIEFDARDVFAENLAAGWSDARPDWRDMVRCPVCGALFQADPALADAAGRPSQNA
jgi:hypothetical protein